MEHMKELQAAEIRRLNDLRAADQRAVDLLAHATAARLSSGLVALSILVALASLGVAVTALVLRH